MSATGYTPIILLNSTTSGNTPTTSNLAVGELAINIADGKLFFNQSGTIKVLANATYATSVSTISFGTTGLTPSTATNGVVTVAGTLVTTNGGTGLSTYTAGDLPYYASGTALSKLGIGSSGQILTSTGSAPQWSTLSGVAVTSFSAGTTGFTPSTATTGAVTLAGTLNVANGGTGVTTSTGTGSVVLNTSPTLVTPALGTPSSVTLTNATGLPISTGLSGLTTNGVAYATSTSALATGSGITYNGTTFSTSNDASIHGLTVGLGGGSVSTNTIVGNGASPSSTGSSAANSVFGSGAGASLTSGVANTLIGYQSGSSVTTQNTNTGVGSRALVLTTSTNNTAVGNGSQSGSNNSATPGTVTGSDNTSVGNQSLWSVTSGSYNSAIGSQALYSNTTASYNTAVGYQAGYTNSSGAGEFFGYQAGYSQTTGARNVAFGIQALQNNQTGGDNTAIGRLALQANTASNSVAVGSAALYQATSGGNNLGFGGGAGSNIITGNGNCYIGINSSASSSSVSNELVVATYNVTGKGGSTGYINANGGGVYQGNNSTLWSVTSDQRLKKNIVDNTVGLSAITQIVVRNFEYRTEDEVTDLPKHSAINIQGVQLGPIAQELIQVLPDCVKTESTGVMSVDSSDVLWHMVNAIKELNTLVTQQAAQIAALQIKVGA